MTIPGKQRILHRSEGPRGFWTTPLLHQARRLATEEPGTFPKIARGAQVPHGGPRLPRGRGKLSRFRTVAHRSDEIQAGIISNVGKLLAQIDLRRQAMTGADQVIARRGQQAGRIDGLPPV